MFWELFFLVLYYLSSGENRWRKLNLFALFYWVGFNNVVIDDTRADSVYCGTLPVR